MLLVMSKFLYVFCLLAFLSFPTIGHAQDAETTPLTSYIGELMGQCPFDQGDDWVIDSVGIVDDTVCVKILAPASLASFMPLLSVDNIKGKRLWVRHLLEYGDKWKQLVELVAKEGFPFKLAIVPRRSEDPYFISCSPDDIGIILAND